MTSDKCRPVVVDGEVIRVRGSRAMNEQEVGYLTEIVRAAKRVMELRPCPECEQGKHTNCDGRTWDDQADDYGPCPCWLNQSGPHHQPAKS